MPNLNPDHAGHLVEVQCRDGVRLNGFLQAPADSSSESLWIIVHGVAGNFYSSALLQTIAKVVRESGCWSLRINTRGHDQIAFASAGALPMLAGSAFESISESALDIAAWIAFAVQHGFRSVNLIGHSLGAIKAAHYVRASCGEDERLIDRLILLSPPRLNHSLMLSDSRHGESFRQDFLRATKAIEEGEPDRLLQIKFPQPLTISAATFLDKYGPASSYDFLKWARELPSTTWIFGEREVRGSRKNFADSDRVLAEHLFNISTHRIHVVPDGDHNYNGVRDDLARLLRDLFV